MNVSHPILGHSKFIFTGISQAAKGSLNSSDGVPSRMSALLKVVGCLGLTSSRPMRAVSRRSLLRKPIGHSRFSRRSPRALARFLESMLNPSRNTGPAHSIGALGISKLNCEHKWIERVKDTQLSCSY